MPDAVANQRIENGDEQQRDGIATIATNKTQYHDDDDDDDDARYDGMV